MLSPPTDGSLEQPITVPNRPGGTGDFWFVTVVLVPLILYLAGLGLVEWDTFFTAVMLVMAGFLAWVYVVLFGSTLRFIVRRARGWPGLHIDDQGIYGAAVNLRGGRLAWTDILAVDHQTTQHSMYTGVALAVSDRIRAKKGLRYLREVDLLTEMLPVRTEVLVPALQAFHAHWAPEAAARAQSSTGSSGLLREEMALQDARLAAIQRGESVTIPFRPGRMRAQLYFGLPFLGLFSVAMLWFAYWMWTAISPQDDHRWVLYLVTPIILGLALLFVSLIVQLLQRYRSAQSGQPLYQLTERGLHEPSRTVLDRTLPWSACEVAYLRRQPKGPDMVQLDCKDLDRYLVTDRFTNRLLNGLNRRFQRNRLTLDYTPAGLRPDELVDLLNEAIFQWGKK